MELWILVALGAGIAVQLGNISSELKFLSNKLNEPKPHETSNLPKEIAEALVWELNVNSTLAKDIAFEVKVSDLDDSIASAIQHSQLDDNIARSIVSELSISGGIHSMIRSAVNEALGYVHAGSSGRAANVNDHLTSIESSLASIEHSLER